ncbi:MAG: RNA polymerase sigma factor [Myxococcota bacterium]
MMNREDPFQESQLLRQAKAGDRQAMGVLIRQHQGAIWAVCRRMFAGQPEDAADVAQDAVVKLIKQLPRFDPDGSARLETWIVTVTTRVCLDALRRRKIRQVSPLSMRTETQGEPESRAFARQVEDYVARLPAEQRAVLVLRSYHDLELEEIAEALGVPKGTIKSRLSRARSALRDLMETTGSAS